MIIAVSTGLEPNGTIIQKLLPCFINFQGKPEAHTVPGLL